MNWRYNVEYPDHHIGGKSYGIFRNAFDKKAEDLTLRGLCHVDHLIYPHAVEVKLKDVVDVKEDVAAKYGSLDQDLGYYLGGGVSNEYLVLVQMLHDIRSARLTGPDLQVGHQFAVGVADGAANYVVTKVSKINCQVEWRGFNPDRYFDHHFRTGGSFRKAEVSSYVHMNEGLDKIFGRDNLEQLHRRVKAFSPMIKAFGDNYGYIPRDVYALAKTLRLVI